MRALYLERMEGAAGIISASSMWQDDPYHVSSTLGRAPNGQTAPGHREEHTVGEH